MRTKRELLYAWLLATLPLSGIPSTVYALLTGGDPLEATRAAADMLLSSESSLIRMLLAATLVHASVSLFWSIVLWLALPRRRTMLWALLASAAIALVDLRVIAPAFFPQVAALAFWPQFTDHLMWGACYSVGLSLGRPRATRP